MHQHVRTTTVRSAVVVAAATAALLTGVIAQPANPESAEAPLAAPPAAAPAAAVPVVETRVVPVVVAQATRMSAMQSALSKVGAPYRYGSAGPSSFDCSGLVHWAYKRAGVSLPRTSRAMSRVGTPVAKSDLQPGDLVFFYSPVSHVAIYVGNGQIVHASTSGKPVKVAPLAGRKFTSARRV